MNRVQVFQRVDNTDNSIHRINRYPVDSVVCVNAYPLDSDLFNVIHPLSNSGQLIRNGNGKRSLQEIHSPESMARKKVCRNQNKGQR